MTTTVNDASLNIDDFVCFAAYSTSHAFNRIYKSLLGEIDLTYPQYLVMVLLWKLEGQSVGELGEKLFLESNTLTPLLKRLEALGYIARRRSSADERQVIVHLTESGRAIREKALHVPACILNASGLNADEAKKLLAAMNALRHAIKGNGAVTSTKKVSDFPPPQQW